ncbi:MAG TPA: prephenate dehydrogenase/arogenate dehydrogenase family protein [Vicinamibacterales bacterium]|nr:prephenate dehydrogenase/arogenate dehydrogenase family protein [Vicinamibacterales bacterium]
MPDPPFKTLSVVGLGLIGGSIALAVRERWPGVRIAGVDRKAVLAHALGSGAIDRSADSAADVADADLIILAAPVRQNLKLLAEIAQRLPSTTIVTDVGSTKQSIVNAAAALSCTGSFVGGHPIGGAEQGGFGFARPDLFRHRPWIFTPGPSTPATVLERVFDFARGLGARPSSMDAAEHDRVMAFLSHLPQLAASALMDVIGSSAGENGLRLAGRGLVDTTRLASSPPDTWRDVCATNAQAVGEALDVLIDRLSDLRADLQSGEAVTRVFTEAARWRAELMSGRD